MRARYGKTHERRERGKELKRSVLCPSFPSGLSQFPILLLSAAAIVRLDLSRLRAQLQGANIVLRDIDTKWNVNCDQATRAPRTAHYHE